jgi:hypothetical protein
LLWRPAEPGFHLCPSQDLIAALAWQRSVGRHRIRYPLAQ